MVTKDDIESFLDRLDADGASYSEVEPGFWVVQPEPDSSIFDVAVNYSPPVVLLRVEGHDAAEGRRAVRDAHVAGCSSSTRRICVHGSYGIEDDSIVLTEALELSHLDYEEFLASYESMTLALASHLRELGSYREAR